jgi:predicted ATPase
LHPDGMKSKIANASSGQQEAIPLCRYLFNSMYRSSKGMINCIGIEEPEAHLFPEAQWNMLKLISLVSSVNSNINFIVTTHSPYVLTAINMLIKSTDLSVDKKESIFKAESPEIFPININNVSAYSLQNGKTADIIDLDARLISANVIDEISDKLSSLFQEMVYE